MSATVLHRDLRQLGYCNRGARAWFRRKGLGAAWAQLVREGIPASVLEPFAGDAMVDPVLARAYARAWSPPTVRRLRVEASEQLPDATEPS